MAKDAYYFSHDSNARNDEKMIAVRMKFGAEGYGIFFMILERLMESSEYMSVKDYNIIAFDLRVDASKVKSIIEDFGLFVFTEGGKYFYSESFNRRMVPLDNIKEQRSLAGKKSAEKRAKKANNPTTVERSLVENTTKERKVKESKEIPPIPPVKSESVEPIISISSVKDKLLAEDIWKEEACRQSGQGISYYARLPDDIDKFLSWIIATGEESTVLTLSDAKRRFFYWNKNQIQNGNSKSNKKETRTNSGKPVEIPTVSFR